MDATDRSKRVQETHREVESALSSLADELSTARDASWDDHPDLEGAGSRVLTVSTALAAALVDQLAGLELEYTDLDGVIDSIVRLARLSEEAAKGSALLGELYAALRELSYDSPNLEAFPDVEDCNTALDSIVGEIRDFAGSRE